MEWYLTELNVPGFTLFPVSSRQRPFLSGCFLLPYFCWFWQKYRLVPAPYPHSFELVLWDVPLQCHVLHFWYTLIMCIFQSSHAILDTSSRSSMIKQELLQHCICWWAREQDLSTYCTQLTFIHSSFWFCYCACVGCLSN